jgi:hypothetical protein
MRDDPISTELTRLGKLTADGIARSLRRLGCQGVRGCPGQCPVARRLRQVSRHRVKVGATFAGYLRRGHVQEYSLPGSVTHFVVAFDRGAFPHLARSSARA